ncbi:MAG: tetratricopeptide repeat protein [Pseudomonadota bacterium]
MILTAPMAEAASIDVCGDFSAPAAEVAYHCRLAIEAGGLNARQEAAAQLNRADALSTLGQHDLAIEAFNAAQTLAPGYIEIYIGRARAFEARRDLVSAERDWNRALGLAKDSVDVRLGRGAFYLRAGYHDRALHEFSEALSSDPENADALYNRAVTWLALKDQSSAETDLTKLIGMAPNDAGAHYHRGRARQGRNDRAALADFAKAAELAPAWSAPWFLSGRLLDGLGRSSEADSHLRRAFELGHQDPWLLERIRKLGG